MYKFLDLADSNAPYLTDIHEAIKRVVNSGRYVGGEECESFEELLAKTTGTKFAVGTGNGLDALRLIFEGYKALGRIHEGDEVIVPANTYIASMLAVTQAGLKVVPVEPAIDSLNIDSSRIAEALTPRTRAILTVHLYGRVAFDMEMLATARNHDLLIIEDNAQAIGAESPVRGVNGTTTGSLGHAAAFSFYPTKNIGALGDAGAITTSDEELAHIVRALGNYGSRIRYKNEYQGFNSRLDPVQAAVLKVKLPHLDEENRLRREKAAIYTSQLAESGLILPSAESPLSHVWHQYVILSPKRDSIRSRLLEAGVQTDIHYPIPPHRQQCYRSELGNLEFPVAERIARECLSLPISRTSSTEDIAEIARILATFGH